MGSLNPNSPIEGLPATADSIVVISSLQCSLSSKRSREQINILGDIDDDNDQGWMVCFIVVETSSVIFLSYMPTFSESIYGIIVSRLEFRETSPTLKLGTKSFRPFDHVLSDLEVPY
ncbi:hypothetical protein HAX54_031736 [Datura stramonium]|uniref:Uncharacterized protein n=1 Tax=Datura stramonium TaxID=4076 RepID=A0ABS8SC58_DATST|nr:hypothetical protein [Datura stramonium]